MRLCYWHFFSSTGCYCGQRMHFASLALLKLNPMWCKHVKHLHVIYFPSYTTYYSCVLMKNILEGLSCISQFCYWVLFVSQISCDLLNLLLTRACVKKVLITKADSIAFYWTIRSVIQKSGCVILGELSFFFFLKRKFHVELLSKYMGIEKSFSRKPLHRFW